MTTASIDSGFRAWAQRAFAAEVATGFRRARIFDGFISTSKLRALEGLPDSTLRLLTQALPTGAGFTGAAGEAALEKLPADQRNAVQAFRDRVTEVWDQRFNELGKLILKAKEHAAAAEEIRRKGLTLAGKLGADIGRKFPESEVVWGEGEVSFSREHVWGRLLVTFGFRGAFEFGYSLSIYDKEGSLLRFHDDYLGILGIGPSACSVESVDECEAKLLEAHKFARWHMGEYETLMDGIMGRT